MYFNVKAFEALIKKYRSIKLEDINKVEIHYKERNVVICYNIIARHLTGFGNSQTCSLCIAARGLLNNQVGSFCNRCCYSLLPFKAWDFVPCVDVVNSTYYGINHATSQENLFAAFRARADYMELVVLPLVPKE